MIERKNDSMFFGIATNSDVINVVKKIKANMVRGCNDILMTITISENVDAFCGKKTLRESQHGSISNISSSMTLL